jgi:phosphoribosylanthranilate isomerase
MNRVRVKICGLTRPEDVTSAVIAGADALGFNFYAPSPRSISVSVAAQLLERVPLFVESVAVCVDPERSWLDLLLRELPRLRSLQWHGENPPLPRELALPLIPAFRVQDAESLDTLRDYLDRCGENPPAAVLIDSHVPGLHGGTGKTAPWELLASLDLGVPLILAGGLTPENVADSVRQVRPYAVDTASGVESAPGVKDMRKMRAFVMAATSPGNDFTTL